MPNSHDSRSRSSISPISRTTALLPRSTRCAIGPPLRDGGSVRVARLRGAVVAGAVRHGCSRGDGRQLPERRRAAVRRRPRHREALADGADEIDTVLPYRQFATGRLDRPAEVLDRVRSITDGQAVMKVILETGELPDLDTVDPGSPVRDRSRCRLRQDLHRQEPGVGVVACRRAHALGDRRRRPPGRAQAVRWHQHRRRGRALHRPRRVGSWEPAGCRPSTFRFGASGLLDALLAAAGESTSATGGRRRTTELVSRRRGAGTRPAARSGRTSRRPRRSARR